MYFTDSSDRRQGIWIWRGSDGEIIVEENYLDGQLHGEVIDYYSGGNILRKRNFLNGELNGEFISFWRSGNLYYKCDHFADKEINYEQLFVEDKNLNYYFDKDSFHYPIF
jgi:antitoxin component YwqK of YwqJK toxin-antitoxin module